MADNEDAESQFETQQIPVERLIKLLAQQRQRAHYGEDRPGLTDARQPEQPGAGPGGCEYKHAEVKANLYAKADLAYWVFEPTSPSPKSAPLIVLLHGWGGGSPARFGAWIDHLVKRGNLVVFPLYQGSLQPWARPWERVPPTKMLGNVVEAVRDAINRLATGDHVRPVLDQCAIVGFSLGGTLSVQMAAVAAGSNLPIPKAVMTVAPGRGLWARRPLPTVDLQTIPPSILMPVVVCADDKNAGDHEGKAIYTQTSQVPPENKTLIVVVSDYHGTPPLIANHNSPVASNPAYGIGERDLAPANALHYYGYWKLLDGLTDAAFFQTNREYALGNTVQQRFMGVWSDGVPVQELQVIPHSQIIEPEYSLRFRLKKRWRE